MFRISCTMLLPLSSLLLGLGEVGIAAGLPLGVLILGGVSGLWVDWRSFSAARAALEE